MGDDSDVVACFIFALFPPVWRPRSSGSTASSEESDKSGRNPQIEHARPVDIAKNIAGDYSNLTTKLLAVGSSTYSSIKRTERPQFRFAAKAWMYWKVIFKPSQNRHTATFATEQMVSSPWDHRRIFPRNQQRENRPATERRWIFRH